MVVKIVPFSEGLGAGGVVTPQYLKISLCFWVFILENGIIQSFWDILVVLELFIDLVWLVAPVVFINELARDDVDRAYFLRNLGLDGFVGHVRPHNL